MCRCHGTNLFAAGVALKTTIKRQRVEVHRRQHRHLPQWTTDVAGEGLSRGLKTGMLCAPSFVMPWSHVLRNELQPTSLGNRRLPAPVPRFDSSQNEPAEMGASLRLQRSAFWHSRTSESSPAIEHGRRRVQEVLLRPKSSLSELRLQCVSVSSK